MKKAKIMLTAIGLFATLGGVLAFKANRFNGPLFCTNNTTYCDINLGSRYQLNPNSDIIRSCRSAVSGSGPCTITDRVQVNP